MSILKEKMPTVLGALIIASIFTIISNALFTDASIYESIIGVLFLFIIAVIGYVISFLINKSLLSPVLIISILAIFLASPISPFSTSLIYYVDKISINAIITYILAYAGVIVGKDRGAFKKVGIKGVIVSIFVILGTFLISSLLGDILMRVFS